MARVLGNRDTATFIRLYDKVTHIKDCIFYTDNWAVFADVLSPERHIADKAHKHGWLIVQWLYSPISPEWAKGRHCIILLAILSGNEWHFGMTDSLKDDFFDARTLAVLDSLPFGVYYCDTNLVVRYINQPYAEYLGVCPQNVIGRKVTEFIPTARAPQIIQSGLEELYDESSVLQGKENQRILINRIPLFNDKKQTIGFISQLISVGKGGWNALWDKIEQAEQVLQRVRMRECPQFCEGQHLVGESTQIKHCIEQARCFAETDESVLVTGPTGVGKELFANILYRHSHRANSPLVSVNCAAISQEFIVSELFGYAPGAFTGALRSGKAGQIELASGGILFLDEIGDLPLHSQGVLLRVLETKQVQRLNAKTGRHVDFRLISATNRDLNAMVAKGMFREDLFYRINALQLAVPPLSQREGDIPILVRHFQNRFGKRGLWVDEEAMELLQHYSWPGNVRELRNAMIYAAVQAKYARIRPQHLPPSILAELRNMQVNPLPMPSAAPPSTRGEIPAHTMSEPMTPHDAVHGSSLADYERLAIASALQIHQGNMTKACKRLGISRTTLYKKIRKYGLFGKDSLASPT